MSESTLGRDTPQVNARSKVLGRALYAGDIQLPGMLHGKVLRSPYARARASCPSIPGQHARSQASRRSSRATTHRPCAGA